jgi:hypothetical protein
MKTYKPEQLKEILELHQKWLNDEDGGIRANLIDANLSDANLTGANLIDANLTGANLTYANLIDANLTRANLIGANLTDAYLYRANLTRANLTRANLTDANLTGANLTGAYLTGAYLYRAKLIDVNLTYANLIDANLTRADLMDTIGNNKEIKSLQLFDEYGIAYTKDRLQIGCKNHSFQEWWNFSDKEILAMDGKKALSFWKKNKEMIKNIVESNPAV